MVGNYQYNLNFTGTSVPYSATVTNYVLKFDSSGLAKWGHSIPGAVPTVFGVAADNCGNIWTTGGCGASSMTDPEPITIAEFDTGGTFLFSTTKNSGGDDQSSVAVDNKGHLYIGGDYRYTPFIVGSDVLYLVSGSIEPLFIAKFTYPHTCCDPMSSPGFINGPSTVCVGGTIMLFDTVTTGTWAASNTNASVTLVSGIVTGIHAGIDTINYIVPSGCTTVSASAVVTVNGIPNPGVIVGTDTVCPHHLIALTDTVIGGVWSTVNGNALIDTMGLLTGIVNGLDTARYIVTNSCGSSTAVFPFVVARSLACITSSYNSAYNPKVELELFPNPANGSFYIKLVAPANEHASILITTIKGEKILQLQTETNISIPVSLDHGQGIFLIKAVLSEGVVIEKLDIR
jgi:hypothetical protein